MDVIVRECSARCQELSIEATPANAFQVYREHLRSRAHVILAMEASRTSIDRICRSYPSLLGHLTVDWFQEWPEEALLSVATAHLKDTPCDDALLRNSDSGTPLPKMQSCFYEASSTADAARSLLHTLPTLHVASREHFISAPSGYQAYFDLIAILRQSVATQYRSKTSRLERLTKCAGLIQDSAKQADLLKKVLAELETKLVTAIAEADAALPDVHAAQEAADESSDVATKRHAEATAVEEAALNIEREIEEAERVAAQGRDEAVEGLQKLSASQLREIRSMSKPTAVVMMTMTALCMFLRLQPTRKLEERSRNKADDYWDLVQSQLLKEPKKLLEDLISFEAGRVSEEVVESIRPILDRDDLDPSQMEKAPLPCKAICTWLRAMSACVDMKRTLQPKRAEASQARARLEAATEATQSAESRSKQDVASLHQVKADLDRRITRKIGLESEVATTREKISRCQWLMESLGEERRRWGQAARTLQASLKNIVGDCTFAAAVAAYGSALCDTSRQRLAAGAASVLKDRKVSRTDGVDDLAQIIVHDTTLRNWHACGLPEDRFAIESAAIMDSARRWPLMIDPQKQAGSFMRSFGKSAHGGGDDFHSIKFADPKQSKLVEASIDHGRWIMLELGAQDLEAVASIIVERQLYGGPHTDHSGLLDPPWADGFHLFLLTEDQNPRISSNVKELLFIINFTASRQGLEELILNSVIARENPESAKLWLDTERTLAMILHEVDVLDETLLNAVLGGADMGNSVVVAESLVDSQKLLRNYQAQVDLTRQRLEDQMKQRSKCQSLASEAAELFEVLVSLVSLSPMYTFSLEWFCNVCLASMLHGSVMSAAQRLPYHSDSLPARFFRAVLPTLTPVHASVFGFAMCTRLEALIGKVDLAELRYLQNDNIAGSSGSTDTSAEAAHAEATGSTSGLPALAQSEAHRLAREVPCFRGLEVSLACAQAEWEEWYHCPWAETLPLPDDWSNRLTSFQKLCVYRALRVDCVERAVRSLICETFGASACTPRPLKSLLHSCFEASTCSTPLLVIISDDSGDVVPEIIALGRQCGVELPPAVISLGQGEVTKARRIVSDAAAHGRWAILGNCHLVPSWLPELDSVWDAVVSSGGCLDGGFRLWLTAAPLNSFPQSVLRVAIKVSTAPPNGIRSGLVDLWGSIADAEVASSKAPRLNTDDSIGDAASPAWRRKNTVHIRRRMSIAIGFMHLAIRERQRYSSFKWNSPCCVLPDSLHSAQSQLEMLFAGIEGEDDATSSESGSLERICNASRLMRHLLIEVIYNSFTASPADRTLLRALLARFVPDDMVEYDEDFLGLGPFSFDMQAFSDSLGTSDAREQMLVAMPPDFSCEVLGLHISFDRARRSHDARKLLDGISSLMQAGTINDGDVPVNTYCLTTCKESLTAIKERFHDISALHESYTRLDVVPTGSRSWLSRIRERECTSYHRLLMLIQSSLNGLESIFEGGHTMDDEAEQVALCIQNGRVPDRWSDKSFPSDAPLAGWFVELSERVRYMRAWRDQEPDVHWVSAFIFTRCFLLSVLLDFASTSAIPMDLLHHRCHVVPVSEDGVQPAAPQSGVFTRGWFLEGCTWNFHERTLDHLSGESCFTSLPLVWLLPERESSLSPEGVHISPSQQLYHAPVYRTRLRRGTSLCPSSTSEPPLTIGICSEEHSDVWVLAGVALLLYAST
eukprot:TRINITY_DN23583_c0_g1_i1.p1 TRINITY_DN23583_c0_g1~~TRINITY_DN23583_c0_g1_i1.p1  ORF type:complete len:1726 (-),score=195.99 TRINITY_DN23583_c0_g1_i1:50-5110(-)